MISYQFFIKRFKAKTISISNNWVIKEEKKGWKLKLYYNLHNNLIYKIV